ncbi:MAG TPA: hypothetical protein VIK84_02605 [Haloplasmataceae bacterium]
MKKTLFSLGLMCLFSLTLFLGTTYAWFSETIVVSNNAIRTGTFDIEFLITDPNDEILTWYDLDTEESKIFDCDYLYPGYSESKILKISNTGEIDAAIRLYTINGSWSHESIRNAVIFSINGLGSSIYFDVNHNSFLVLKPGETIQFEVSFTIDPKLDNIGQAQYLLFDVVLEAIQVGEALTRDAKLYYLPAV